LPADGGNSTGEQSHQKAVPDVLIYVETAISCLSM